MLDAGTHFISKKIENICRWLSIHHAVSSSYNHQSNRQAEACIKFVKWTFKNVLRIMLTYMWLYCSPNQYQWLPSPATILSKRPTKGVLPKFYRQQVLCNNDENNLIALLERQSQKSQDKDTDKNIPFLYTGLTVAVQREDGWSWMHGMIIEQRRDGQSGRYYTVWVTKMNCAITRTKRHIKPTNTAAVDYSWNESTKANQTPAADRLNELVYHFM